MISCCYEAQNANLEDNDSNKSKKCIFRVLLKKNPYNVILLYSVVSLFH